MRRHERAGPVQDPDAGAFEPRELPQTGLDPVQPRGDVEAADGNVTLAEGARGDGRLEYLQTRARACERHVRPGPSMGHDRDLHAR